MRKLDERVYLNQVESSALVKWHSTHNKGTATHSATRCNTLQHTATHCNTLQHTATFEWHSTHNKGTWHGGMVKKIYQVSVLLHVPYPSL